MAGRYVLPQRPFKTDPKTGKVIGARYEPNSDADTPNQVEGDPEKAKEFANAIGQPWMADAIDKAQAGENPLSSNVNIQKDSSKVEPKDTSATSGDVGPDGLTYAEMDAGAGNYNSPPKAKPLGENVLYEYASVNNIFTFACLTPEMVNFPDSTYRQNGFAYNEHLVIAHTGGKRAYSRMPTHAELEFNVSANYFIDNVVVETVIAPNAKSRATNYFNVSFNVLEPYSMGQLLQSLAVVSKAAGYSNYLEAVWILIIDFVGFDDDGNQVPNSGARKYLPIKLTGVELNVDTSGSSYAVSAIAWNDVGFRDAVQTLSEDVVLSGKTVKEALQTGLNSLATHLNTIELNKRLNTEHKAEVDEYIIVFPTDTSSAGLEKSILGLNSDDETATSGDLAYKSFTDEEITTAFTRTNISANHITGDKAETVIDNNFKRKFVEGRLGYSVKRGKLSEQLKSVLANATAPANIFGKSELKPISGLDAGAVPFGLLEFAYNKETGLLERGATSIDPTQRTIMFKQGTKIQKVIEEIVLLSEWAKSILNENAFNEKTGMRKWFRIESSVYIVNDTKSEKAYGRKPRIYLYRVVPYDVHKELFQLPNTPPPSFKQLMEQAPRAYNYIYTGQNNDILEFDLNFNAAFYEGFAKDLGKNRGNNDTASQGVQNSDVEVEATDNTQGVQPDAASETVFESYDPKSETAGAFRESTALQIAKQYNEAIVNSSVSLLSIEMEVLGDPFYIADSGVGNYNSEGTQYINITSDNSINYQNGQVDILINFRTPVDIGDGHQGYLFDNKTMALNEFSGLYRLMSITNNFSGNVFTQQIRALRRKNFEYTQQDIEDYNDAIDIKSRRIKRLAEATTDEEREFIAADLNLDNSLSRDEQVQAGLTTDEAIALASGAGGKAELPSDEEVVKNSSNGETTTTQSQAATADDGFVETAEQTPKTVRSGSATGSPLDRYYRYGNNNR